jgi:predicted permease
MLSDLGHDARLGLRGLLKDRGFALAALLSIGLGVGANSAIFSLVDQALFRLLPVVEPERLVLLDWRGTFVGYGWGSSNLMSFPFYQQLRAETVVFDGVFGRHPTLVNLAVESTPEPVSAEIVTGSYFEVLGVRPYLGRLIADSDDLQPGAHPVVAVSYDYWRNRLGAARDIIGRTVRVNNHPMTLIGVAEPGFHGIDWGEVPSLWIPTMMKRQATPHFDWLLDRRGRWLHVFGRLKPGITIEEAKAGLQPWFKAMLVDDTRRDDWPRVSQDQRRRFLASWLDVLPASHGRSDLRRRLERPLAVLLAATALILLLACLNVANLYLARGFARRKEAALQLALGASRGRVARALLVQSGILALGGAALGILLAPVVTHALISFLPESAAAVDLSSEINLRMFLFAMGLAMLTAVLFGLAPAVQAAGAQPGIVLKEESGTIGTGIGLRKVLVIGQIALALVLLIGAGLFVRTLVTLRAKGPGFITTNQVMVSIDPARNGYSVSEADRLIRSLLDTLRTLPEVESVGLATASLLAGGSWNQPLTLEARERLVTKSVVHCNAVSAGFFETLGVRVIAGRDFNERDSREVESLAGPQVNERAFRSAVINQSLARRYFGDANPVGARLGIGGRPDTKTNVEIVGVVEDFAYRGLREMDDQAFFPYFEGGGRGGTFWLRTRTSSEAATAAVRAAVRQLDPTLPIRARTVDDQLDTLLVNERLLASLASAFAAVATLLAVIGVYGVMSFVVTGRTREIGIRLALGASPRATVWLILRDGTTMLIGGIALALPVVWGLGRFIESQLFGVHAMDWPTLTGAAVMIALVALGASGVPVRRAVSVSPVDALRYQ